MVGETPDGRLMVHNPDGSLSSERTITIKDPRINQGQATVIPSMFGGRQLDDRQAIEVIARTGGVDPDTGRVLTFAPTFEEADRLAADRSNKLRLIEMLLNGESRSMSKRVDPLKMALSRRSFPLP